MKNRKEEKTENRTKKKCRIRQKKMKTGISNRKGTGKQNQKNQNPKTAAGTQNMHACKPFIKKDYAPDVI